MTNWKYTLTRWLASHPATSEEIALIKVKCGLTIPAVTPVLGTVLVTDSEGKSERGRITLHLRTPEVAGNIKSPKGIGGNGAQEESGDFVLVDRIVCFIVNTNSGRFSAIPWDQIAYVST